MTSDRPVQLGAGSDIVPVEEEGKKVRSAVGSEERGKDSAALT